MEKPLGLRKNELRDTFESVRSGDKMQKNGGEKI